MSKETFDAILIFIGLSIPLWIFRLLYLLGVI